MLDIHKLRQDYQLRSLDLPDLDPDPIKQFEQWFQEALHAHVLEPNAMTLATASLQAAPSCRTMLLKAIDTGFIFFTNYESRKGRELDENPQASLGFLWKELERQVIIEGCAEKLSRQESERYFLSRPRGSQLGAWASHQSQVIPSRSALEEAFEHVNKEYEGKIIPLPPYWGGYRLLPKRFEFWQGRHNRLHDRLSYKLINQIWTIERLAP
ncbi:pyridoxamine 5'-phosphate oxidase [Candidatus Protochlamydia phocaeensis]|uniref:pyridoxamine 5'-phosphate oxidase n=1 Tax=Candidatus Protochlamydia phocaeensis TaxID=1414722 RepID=UPI0008388206|nr:pyridoxamine 5'-phosphate oxidase [Candidatus Protochlamydia phocaeensis]